MNVIYIDPTGLTYVLADVLVETTLEEYQTTPGFDCRSLIDKVNQNAAEPGFEGFRRVEFFRICDLTFRKRAVDQPKPLVDILCKAAAVCHEMYRDEVMQDG